MKYCLLSLLLFISISSFADKKKAKTNAASKKETTTNTNATKQNPDTPTPLATPVSEDGSGGSEYITSDNYKAKKPSMQIDQPLIPFKCKDNKGNPLTNDNLKKGKIIVMLYNPGCEHCLMTAQKINQNLNNMPETSVLFLSGEDTAPMIPEFMKAAGIDAGDERFVFALIGKDLQEQIFEYNGIPQVMAYDEEKMLRKVFYRDVDMNDFMTYFR